MSGEKLSKKDWEDEQFQRLLDGLPSSCPIYDDGAICPWCGYLHLTVNFGKNECNECHRLFIMGIPQWGSIIDYRPETYAEIPFKEFEHLKGGSMTIPKFIPTDDLKHHYKQFALLWPEAYGEKRPPDERLN